MSSQGQSSQTGSLTDLDDAIEHLQSLFIPKDVPDKYSLLKFLGMRFLNKFNQTSMSEDLDNAIKSHLEASLVMPDGHPDQPVLLGNIGNYFLRRFERTGVLSDLEEAMKNHQQAVSLAPDGHPQPTSLDGLGNCFLRRFERTGTLSDLEQAIENQRQAVLLTPDGHPSRPSRLNNLGNSFLRRFECTGVLSDLEEAIENQQQAVSLTPDGHPSRPLRLNNFANCLLHRFERTGVLIDLEKAIENQQQVVLLTPDGHPSRPLRLNNFANCFLRRFKRTGVLSDLEKAIENQRQAVLLTPDGHPEKPFRLHNLGNFFQRRFEHTGVLSDIEKAIENQRQAVLLTPDGHFNQPLGFNSLGNSLVCRFERTGVLSDLEEAIMNQQQAVLLTPDGHPDKPTWLNNLGNSFLRRFEHIGMLSDLEEAIENQRQAELLTPDGHPDKPSWLHNLGISFQNRFQQTGVPSDLETAISHFQSAAISRTGTPLIRSTASRSSARLLFLSDNLSRALEAYHHAITLIPHIAWIGDPVSIRHSQLTQVADIPREAAACALEAGQSNLALEWLEEGRSIFWTQTLNLRSSSDQLKAHPAVYEEFVLVSRQLQNAATRGQAVQSSSAITSSLEEETQRHHRLAEEWDSLVNHIRSLPGLDDFLLPKKISSLRRAAESGLVVVINVHKLRCDALVLSSCEDVHHIPLPALSYADVDDMLKSLKRDLATHARIRGEVRASRPVRRGGSPLPTILSKLFSTVVRPVLEDLGLIVENPHPSNLPRIWWCPTGPLTFLPLHAAGIDCVDGGREEASDYVISSYIPSINSLLEARAENRPPFDQLAGIAMVNNPPSHKLNPLPGSRVELEKIGALFNRDSSGTFTTLQDEQATKKQVLAAMESSPWVHLACHASQDTKNPTESGLWLHDGALTIADLILKRFQKADFAFLSACQTATGDENASDEAVHITAAMLGAGYRSVIGTMWPIPDAVAPILAGKVYEALCRGKPDSEKAARALHEAVKELRKSGEDSLHSWVPFVHYGF